MGNAIAKKAKTTDEPSTQAFKESLGKAFLDVVRNALKKQIDLVFSIDGKVVVVEAKQLRSIKDEKKSGVPLERAILLYAKAKLREAA